jgi:hypothetical protein
LYLALLVVGHSHVKHKIDRAPARKFALNKFGSKIVFELVRNYARKRFFCDFDLILQLFECLWIFNLESLACGTD